MAIGNKEGHHYVEERVNSSRRHSNYKYIDLEQQTSKTHEANIDGIEGRHGQFYSNTCRLQYLTLSKWVKQPDRRATRKEETCTTL